VSRKLTIYEIAQAAGVSTATISRAINPETRHLVSAEKLKQVDDIIERHGYAPSQAAQGLSKSVYHTIGVVMPHGRGLFLNDYYGRILNGVADVLLETRYRFKLLMLKCDSTRWDHYDFHGAEGVDGLIICHWHAFFSDASVLEKMKLPYAVVGDPEPRQRGHFVSPDHEQAGELVAESFVQHGHRKIAVMEGSPQSVDNKLRMRGFRRRLKQHGIEIKPDLALCGHFTQERAVRAMRTWLGRKNLPPFTALFCGNDSMAYGALQVLKEFGLKCPQDVSVIGVDDLTGSNFSDPPLTTIRLPLYEVACLATEHLLEHLRVKDKRFEKKKVLLPVELVMRKSVRQLGRG
jgi:LacI family transcriptional regulator